MSEPEYRNFLNQGTGMQVVKVPVDQRLNYLSKVMTEVDYTKLGNGIEQFVNRISYSDFLSQVMDKIPEFNSYENGHLFINTLKHIFMPRLFFPDKEILNDSQMTNMYTGRHYSGPSKGVSVGLGYMAYYYIDFGKYAMLLFIFLQGSLFGWVYKYFSKRVQIKFLVYSVTLPIVMGVYVYETSQPNC